LIDPITPKHPQTVRRWFIIGAALSILRVFRNDWLAAGAARRRWGRVFGLWTLASLIFTALVVWIGTVLLTDAQVVARERGVLRALDAADPVSFNSALWLEGLANGFVMWIAVGVATLLAARARKPLLAASFFLGFGVLYINIFFGWFLWPRARPSIIAEGLASPGALSSYPSGHAAQAVFVYGMFAFLWIRRARSSMEKVAAVLAVLFVVGVVGFGRLRLGSHWPSDLAAGYLIAAVWTFGVTRALNAAEE
jgi:undecaprenyl-diphosphatase